MTAATLTRDHVTCRSASWTRSWSLAGARAARDEPPRRHRALRQVLAAAVRWQWIDRDAATDVANPMHARAEFDPFESWEEVDALACELGPFGPLAIFCVGTGVRPKEAFGADWTDVDSQAGVLHRAERSPRGG